MNEAPESNVSGANDTFSSQSAPATNPFTADLKGEFTSNFGTNTNAVSQIFKEGGFASDNRKKYIILGAVLVVLLAVVFTQFMGDDEEGFVEGEMTDELVVDEAGDEYAEGEDELEGATAEGEEIAGEAVMEEAPVDYAAETSEASYADTTGSSYASAGTSYGGGSGAITLSEPGDGANISYDETQGSASFTWSGGDGYIVFSRNATMSPEIIRARASGNSYSFHHPWPGTWYWKLENGSGSSQVRSFTVNPAVRRNVQVAEPGAGMPVAGTGGTVSWQGDNAVAFYRVEMSQGGWANPQYKFATSGNSVQLQGVAPGQYNMRIGAFSEVSGRWEYTTPQAVEVQ